MNKQTFTCERCYKEVTGNSDFTTGYALLNNKKICYACCAEMDKEYMIETGKEEVMPNQSKPLYLFSDGTETYFINAKGEIGRRRFDWTPYKTYKGEITFSGQWKALALVQFKFGHVSFKLEFDKWPEAMPLRDMNYKNGTPKFHLMDLDHGTTRIWGRGIRYLSLAEGING